MYQEPGKKKKLPKPIPTSWSLGLGVPPLVRAGVCVCVLGVGGGVRDQGLGAGCAHCSRDIVASASPRPTEVGERCGRTRKCTDARLHYFSICPSVSAVS